MKSFVDLDNTLNGQPPRLGVLLARVDRGQGREDLYRDQLPQLLSSLSEETRIASIEASNAIEGIDVDPERAVQISRDGALRFRNRNEREFAGYRDAIDGLMRASSHEPPTIPFVLHLHRQLLRHTDQGGGRLKQDQNLIVSNQSGRREVIFSPPSPKEAEFFLSELMARYNEAAGRETAHPLILLGALLLDFLAIHPVADGNGRLSRLLMTNELARERYGIARYVSIEQRIFETKSSYYASIYESQQGWHECSHSIWPWVEYLVGTLAGAYDDFERRVAAAQATPTSKQQRVEQWVREEAAPVFRIRDIRRALPGISDQTIRIVLNRLRQDGLVKPDATGRGATWSRTAAPVRRSRP